MCLSGAHFPLKILWCFPNCYSVENILRPLDKLAKNIFFKSIKHVSSRFRRLI